MTDYNQSPVRRLQIYTLDPSSATRTDLAVLSRAVIQVKYEPLDYPGPLGEYLEVIDYDPASDLMYEPVDLNQHLGTDGLPPSVANPQFHQQMVYAIAMNTIATFEQVLGRPVIWSGKRRKCEPEKETHKTIKDSYIPALRIYPHALRQDNAYYSPARKALLFGYFNARPTDSSQTVPGSMVFTCLSHDIIVHEMTHAILDGIHPKLLYPTNHDMLAFHEGFSDIVAIFHHFQLPDLLLHEIENTRGDLSQNSLLSSLAVQFARSTGKGDTLRKALDLPAANGQRVRSNADELAFRTEPHERGAILVAAVFDAYLLIYNRRVKDLRRIATNGTGVLPEGDIHPDLARRFADEASKSAKRVLTICIRAIDYLPTVDLTFGEYLRALITADLEAVPHDTLGYRVAFMEAFRERGIYPNNIRALSEETLRWKQFGEYANVDEKVAAMATNPYSGIPTSRLFKTLVFTQDLSDRAINNLIKRGQRSIWERKNFSFQEAEKLLLDQIWLQSASEKALPRTDDPVYREMEYKISRTFSIFIENWIRSIHRCPAVSGQEDVVKFRRFVLEQFGLDFSFESYEPAKFKFQVLAVRRMVQPRPDSVPSVQLAITMVQRVLIPLWKPTVNIESLIDQAGQPTDHVFNLRDDQLMTDADGHPLKFFFRSGCTLIVDPEKGKIRYAIRKSGACAGDTQNCQQGIGPSGRLVRQAQFYREQIATSGEDAIEQFVLTDAAALRAKQRDELSAIHTPVQHEALY